MPYFIYQKKKIYYREEGKGELLILLPGNTASSAVHNEEINYFAQKFRVICPDYIGYGKSERVKHFPVDFWWANANMVVELIHSIKADYVILVGTSGGGIIALNTAIIEPLLVKAVVADSFMGEYLDPIWIKTVVKERETKTNAQKAFWNAAHGDSWEEVIKADSLMLTKAARLSKSLFKQRLKEIKCPVLLTGSLSDDMIPNIEKAMCNVAKQIFSSKIVFYPTGAHPLMWSERVKFRKEVINFINSLER